MIKATSRQRGIINAIISAEGYISGNDLAKINQISVKTVQRDIKDINEFLQSYNCEIISKRSHGYKIKYDNYDNYKMLKSIVGEIDCNCVYTLEENRVEWLIRKLAFLYVDSETESIKQDELCDELFISLSTLKNDLKVVKSILHNYDLKLSRKGNSGVYISGDEAKFRYFLSDYIVHKIGQEKSETILEMIDTKSSESIKSIIIDVINKYDLNITDLGFDNLFNHIVITITRIKNDKIINEEKVKHIPSDEIEYEASLNLCRQICKLTEIEFPTAEVVYIYQHLKSQNRLFKDDNYFIDEEDNNNLKTIRKSLKEIYLQIGIDFTHDEILENGLLVHLKSVLHRIQYKMKIRNNLLDQIKKNYVLAYELSNFLAKAIEEDMNVEVDENEVGFLALHFGGALERMNIKGRKDRLRVIVICASGMGTSILLRSKLSNRFGSKIQICGVYPSYKLEELDFKDIDLIISTINLQYKNLPIINVSPILSDTDMNKINHFISKGNENYKLDIKSYFKDEIFSPNLKIENYLEVVEYMSNKMYELGYIDEVMKNSFMEREQLSSTEIGNMVAIPHALVGEVKKPGIYVAILEEPIKWVYSEVQLVMMIAINKEVFLEHENLFLDIYNQVDEMYKVEKIINKKDLNYIKKLY